MLNIHFILYIKLQETPNSVNISADFLWFSEFHQNICGFPNSVSGICLKCSVLIYAFIMGFGIINNVNDNEQTNK